MGNIDSLKDEILKAVENATSLPELEEIRVFALGKKGSITGMMKDLGALSIEEKKEAGKILNVVKEEVTSALEAKKVILEDSALNAKLAAEKIDVTLPTRPEIMGRIHPISQVYESHLQSQDLQQQKSP